MALAVVALDRRPAEQERVSGPRTHRIAPLALRPGRVLALATVLALAMTVTAFARTAHASVLWTADAEKSWNQEWANEATQEPSRIQRITSPVAQGSYAYSIELRPGDDPGGYGERSELGMGNPTRGGFPLFHEGDERWVAFQVYLPSDYPIDAPSWNDIMQLKQLGSLGTPALSMGVEEGRFTFKNSATNHEDSQPTAGMWSGPAVANRWVEFLLRVKFSAEPNVGFVELFGNLDGSGLKQLLGQTFTHTMKQENGVTVPSQSRIGQYRDSAMHLGASHIYFDGYTIATDRASAEANAFSGTGQQSAGQSLQQNAGQTASSGFSGESQPAGSPRGQRSQTRSSVGSGAGGSFHSSARVERVHSRGGRVWLRLRPARRVVAARRGRRVVLVGGVSGAHRAGHRTVVIEALLGGSWRVLAEGREGSREHFSLRTTLPAGQMVQLRAHIAGFGYSRVLTTRG